MIFIIFCFPDLLSSLVLHYIQILYKLHYLNVTLKLTYWNTNLLKKTVLMSHFPI